jgi:hypothetical protein
MMFAHWLPRVIAGTAACCIGSADHAGVWFVRGLPAIPDPRMAPVLWSVVAGLTVIVALRATGLRIDPLGNWAFWLPTLRAVAVPGHFLEGVTVAAAILLGAVMARSDPVLNNRLVFPFVYPGLLMTARGLTPETWLVEWLVMDMQGYRCGAARAFAEFDGWTGGDCAAAAGRYGPRGRMVGADGDASVQMRQFVLSQRVAMPLNSLIFAVSSPTRCRRFHASVS